MELLPHQKEAVKLFGKDGRMILHADVGTGKTAIALKSAELVASQGPILYLCPAILKEQIAEEVEKWTDFEPTVVKGNKKQRNDAWLPGGDFYIANFELLLFDFEKMSNIPWQMIIVDECHFLKNPTSKRYKKFVKLRSRYRLAMSGTPFPNAIHEAWTMATWMVPGIFRESFYKFKRLDCIVNEWHSIELIRDDEAFRQRLNPLVHRIKREEVLKLPPLVERRLTCKMGKNQREAYDTLKKELELEIGDEKITVTNILSMLMRLRQITDDPSVLGLDVGNAKREMFKELLEAISSKKIIVFAELTTVLRSLHEEFGGLIIDGSTPQKQRHGILDKFKVGGERILFLSSAGETGLNIQCADTVIHVSLPWNFARVDQREARAYRHGQKKTVTTYRLIVENSVDEAMEKLVEKKKKLTTENLIQTFYE